MSDFAEPLSTALEPDVSTSPGGGAPPAEPKAPETARESLEAVMKNADRRDADAAKRTEVKAEPKADAAEPVEKTAEKVVKDAEAPAAEKAAETDDAKPLVEAERPGEKRPEPPARLSEAAKAVWRNVPRDVQQDVARWEKESEDAKPRLERYESIRQFDELARSNGRDLKDSLAKINQFENMMKGNPIGALNAILQEIGPRKGDGSAITLMEVAQHIVSQGQEGYHRSLQAAQHQQTQAQQEQAMQAREAETNDLQRRLVEETVLKPFMASAPRFKELEADIASLLNSDMVSRTLSQPERLAKAYELAERLNPASSSSSGDQRQALVPERRVDDSSGSKSIKSSPGLVTDDDVDERAKPGESILDSIQAEVRRLKRA